MAGDWIKVEKATARKPEVLTIAAELGIHPDHAFGLCVRFWSWCDDHMSDANARGVSAALVDALLDRSGIATALVKVGWLRVRDGSLEVPNFDRHLSQSSKTRALTKERVARHTTKKTNAPSVSKALAEKRREESSISLSKARASSEQEVIDYVKSFGLPDSDGSYLWNSWEAGGWKRGSEKIVDWKAAARTWITGGWLPSQKQKGGTHGQKPNSRGIGGTYDPTGDIAKQY